MHLGYFIFPAMHKRGTIDLDNETVTAERLLNARGSFKQTSVLSRADSTMKLKTQTQDAKVCFRLPFGALCQPSDRLTLRHCWIPCR